MLLLNYILVILGRASKELFEGSKTGNMSPNNSNSFTPSLWVRQAWWLCGYRASLGLKVLVEYKNIHISFKKDDLKRR